MFAIRVKKPGGGFEKPFGHSETIEGVWEIIETWDLPDNYDLYKVTTASDSLEAIGCFDGENKVEYQSQLANMSPAYPGWICQTHDEFEFVYTIQKVREFLLEAHFHDSGVVDIIQITE